MKDAIHPTYHHDAKVSCACGHTFATGSTQKDLQIEVCSNCHPLYTGTQKVMDAQGRVERFKKMQEKTSVKKTDKLTRKAAKTTKAKK
ncbi:MAG: 50S ribosomal protein L31 [Patescibacteria group bacterium]|jgi:large subunit ribosomal protein L31